MLLYPLRLYSIREDDNGEISGPNFPDQYCALTPKNYQTLLFDNINVYFLAGIPGANLTEYLFFIQLFFNPLLQLFFKSIAR